MKCNPIPARWQEFQEWAMAQLKDAGIKVSLRNSEFVRCDGSRCRGWFDGQELVAAAKHPIFMWTFLHEFCHFLQWKKKPWLFEGPGLFDVLGKRPITCRDWGATWDSIALEHDCESRTIRLGLQWGLLNEQDYAKRANAYLFFYHYVFVTGKWPAAKLDHDELLELMPGKLVSLNRLKSIDMRLMEAYDEILAPTHSGPHLR